MFLKKNFTNNFLKTKTETKSKKLQQRLGTNMLDPRIKDAKVASYATNLTN